MRWMVISARESNEHRISPNEAGDWNPNDVLVYKFIFSIMDRLMCGIEFSGIDVLHHSRGLS